MQQQGQGQGQQFQVQQRAQVTAQKRQSTSLYPSLTMQKQQQEKDEQELERKKRLIAEQNQQYFQMMQQQQQQQQQYSGVTAPIINPSSGSSILGRTPLFTSQENNIFRQFQGRDNNGSSMDDNNNGWNRKGGNRRRMEEMEEEPEDPTKEASTLLLVGVPPEKNNDKEIRAFFSKFGKINSTESWVGHRKAFVKFDTRSEAELAFRSKCAIFDDRNVKIVMEKESTRDKPHKFSIYVPRPRQNIPQKPPSLELSAVGSTDSISSPPDNNGNSNNNNDDDDGYDSYEKSDPLPAKKVRIIGVANVIPSNSSSSTQQTASTEPEPAAPAGTSTQINTMQSQKHQISAEESEINKTKAFIGGLKKKIELCIKIMSSYNKSPDDTKKLIAGKVAKTIMEVDIALWPAGRPKARPQLPDKIPTPSSSLTTFETILTFVNKELADAVEHPAEYKKAAEEAKAEADEKHRLAEQQKKFMSQVSVYSPKLPEGIHSDESVRAIFKGVKKVLFYSDNEKKSAVISFFNHNYAESVNEQILHLFLLFLLFL